MTAAAECRGHGGQGGRRGLTVDGARADPDDQGSVVLAAHTGVS
jgi:hypothetical protein